MIPITVVVMKMSESGQDPVIEDLVTVSYLDSLAGQK